MKNYLLLFLSISLLVISSCDEDNGISNIQLEEGIEGLVTINYEYLATAPIHTQTSMLTGYNNKLYRYGSNWPLQILELNSNSWTNLDLPDETYSRWDGAAVTIEDSIFIVATGTQGNYDIIKFDINSSSLHHTGIELPSDFYYPAYTANNNIIVFLSTSTDSVYEYNSSDKILKKVTSNPFYNPANFNLVLASGRYQNYLYVYGFYESYSMSKLHRLNLINYEWDEIEIPQPVSENIKQGSVYSNNFIFFSELSRTYIYKINEDKWFLDTTQSAIYAETLTDEFILGEVSFYSTDSCLYCTENIADRVWKLKL